MEFGSFTAWLGGSIIIIVALYATYILVKWILKSAEAGDQWNTYAWNIIKGTILVGLLFWTGVNWLYGQNKKGAAESPITGDLVGIIGQAPADFGLGEAAAAAQGQSVATTVPEGSVAPAAPAAPVVPAQPQNVAKPDRITFGAITATGFPNGKSEDVCGYDFSQVGNEWVTNMTILCNSEDQPGEVVSVDPRSLKGKDQALPGIPGNTVAVIVPPTPQPTAIPPTPVPTLSPAQMASQCSQKWAAWKNRVDLSNTQVAYSTGIVPMGVTFTVKGGKAFWSNEKGEDWYISIPAFNVVDFRINGSLGRSLPNPPPKGSVKEYSGTGDQCADLVP